jgi:hypothetical protein
MKRLPEALNGRTVSEPTRRGWVMDWLLMAAIGFTSVLT